MNKKVLVSAILLALTGCSSAPKPPEPEGELVAVNKSLPSEISQSLKPSIPKPLASSSASKPQSAAVSTAPTTDSIKTDDLFLSDELAKATKKTQQPAVKCFSCEKTGGVTVKSETLSVKPVAVAPAVKPMVKPVVKPDPNAGKLSVGVTETAFQAVNRWATAKGLSTAFSVSDAIRARFDEKKDNGFYAADPVASLAMLSEKWSKENPRLRFWANVDQGNHSLIIHDIGDRLDARLFVVEKGPLQVNAFKLAKELGWNVEVNSWTTGTPDYNEVASYKLVVSGDALRSFKDLLDGYNVKAQLVENTKTVFFTPLIKQ